MKDLRILLVGHACFPDMGSEAAVTWNWAWHLAERNRVWVIAHGFARPLVEQYMHDHPRPNLHFIWVGPLGWWDPWKNPTPTKARGLRLHYLLWRHAAVGAARRLMAIESIDIVHHVSWNSISAPPLLWRTCKPFVWGPVGGGHILPWRFLTSLGPAAVPELLRNLRVCIMPWTRGLRRTVARTDGIDTPRHVAGVASTASPEDAHGVADRPVQALACIAVESDRWSSRIDAGPPQRLVGEEVA